MSSIAANGSSRRATGFHAPKTSSSHQAYLNSDRWKNLRIYALDWSRYCCEECSMPRWLAKIAYDQDLNVHHESYANVGTDEEIFDLVVLCRRCHEVETFGRSDLRDPKSAICDLCKTKHWNPWSDKCETCKRITEKIGGGGLLAYMDHLDESVGTGITIEKMFMHCFIEKLGPQHVINRLLEYDDYLNHPAAVSDEELPF
jgi:hypothetical protein